MDLIHPVFDTDDGRLPSLVFVLNNGVFIMESVISDMVMEDHMFPADLINDRTPKCRNFIFL